MAFRNTVYWKTMANALQGRWNNLTTAASPIFNHSLPSQKSGSSKKTKGDVIPMCIALGMIGLSTSLGVYTILHQLGRAPNVSVKKSRRETLPEVVEPEHVAEEAKKFVKQSFFRKVAHIQDSNRRELVPNPMKGDIFTRPVRVETLKDVGMDPMRR